MSYHSAKDEIQLTWMENRELIKLKLRQITRRVEDKVLAELSREFNESLANGEILSINPTQEELQELVRQVSQKQLEA